jgi:hypothetical protein
MFLIVIVMVIIFFIDKRNIYSHYKMQVYQSNDLELSVQRSYIVMFLICVCCGYGVSAIYDWQYYVIGGMFVFSIVANFIFSYREKRKQH